jgi:hypothetical protein
MTQHNTQHLTVRANERASVSMHQVIKLAIQYMINRCKCRRVPNCSWKYCVRYQGVMIGWVCGRGVVVSTYLDATQVAHGEEIR